MLTLGSAFCVCNKKQKSKTLWYTIIEQWKNTYIFFLTWYNLLWTPGKEINKVQSAISCSIITKLMFSSLTFALRIQTREHIFLPAMRRLLTWKHSHSPLRWSPDVKDENGRSNEHFWKQTHTKRSLSDTWLERKSSRPVPRSHRYGLNHCLMFEKSSRQQDVRRYYSFYHMYI